MLSVVILNVVAPLAAVSMPYVVAYFTLAVSYSCKYVYHRPQVGFQPRPGPVF
jgi:hypothetical protein